ncbi:MULTISPECIES: DUF3343 domain-containing protein [Clostridium]|uniref:Putative Se/S carrier protein-like domain-containing protein n=2 Tax=Clostridium TaxID=1485 RepID=A0A151API7_9CLOT|nr:MULTISPECIES: DUF3343 domain-containing protein [Clostridium]KYH29317.1 hypothetical protein CLCOL_10600 [Clostridium colicanis DSM 13634]MBE6043326.1 DUF3343 domain-containing protein [Clostridium thermopalmarium]PRR70969.1 hypothetical protein CPAL_20590 [Clostridium thermopalmarium DSM 5974]PVZ28891.1 uncharacterized protein DUF3343 [Clostridium thermopalmarium DSM 5974]
MKEEVFALVAFSSTHSAIKAEKELMRHELNVRIIPVPREITAGCGLSIRFDLNDLERVKKIIDDNNIETSGYYHIKKVGLSKEIKSIL